MCKNLNNHKATKRHIAFHAGRNKEKIAGVATLGMSRFHLRFQAWKLTPLDLYEVDLYHYLVSMPCRYEGHGRGGPDSRFFLYETPSFNNGVISLVHRQGG